MANLSKLHVDGQDYSLKDLYSRTTLETIKQTLLTLASKEDLGEMEEEVGESIDGLKTTFGSIDENTTKTIQEILKELEDPSSPMKSYLDELSKRLKGLEGKNVYEYLQDEIDRVTDALEELTAENTTVGEEDDRTIKDAIDSIEESKETLEDLIKKVGEKIDDAGSIQIKDTKSIHTVEDKMWIITPEVELFTVYDINKVNISKIALISPLDNETEIGEGESIRITGDDTKVKSKLLIEGENLHMVDVKATNVENGVSRAISLTNRQDISIAKITYDVEFEVSPVMPPDDVISNISISFVMKEEFKDNKFEDESSTELNLGVYSESASYISSMTLSGEGFTKKNATTYNTEITDALTISGSLNINGNNLSDLTIDDLKVLNLSRDLSITFGDISLVSEQKAVVPITITAEDYGSSYSGDIQVTFVKSTITLNILSKFIESIPEIYETSLTVGVYPYHVINNIIHTKPGGTSEFTMHSATSYVGQYVRERKKFITYIIFNGINIKKEDMYFEISNENGGTWSISDGLENFEEYCIAIYPPIPDDSVTLSNVSLIIKYKENTVHTVNITVEWPDYTPIIESQSINAGGTNNTNTVITSNHTVTFDKNTSIIGDYIDSRSSFKLGLCLKGKNIDRLIASIESYIDKGFSITDINLNDSVYDGYIVLTVPAPASGVTKSNVIVALSYNGFFVESNGFNITINWGEEVPTISSISLQSSTGGSITSSSAASPSFTLGTSTSTVGTSITNRSAFIFRLKPSGTNITKLTSATISSSSGGTFTTSGTASNYITVNAPAPASGVTTSKVTIQFKYNSTVIKTVAVTINWGAENYNITGIRFMLENKGQARSDEYVPDTYKISNEGEFNLSSFNTDIDQILNENRIKIQIDGSNLSKLSTSIKVDVFLNPKGSTGGTEGSQYNPDYSGTLEYDEGYWYLVDLTFNGIVKENDVVLILIEDPNYQWADYDNPLHFYIKYTKPGLVVNGFYIDQKVTSGAQSWPTDALFKNHETISLDNIKNTSSIVLTIVGQYLDRLPSKVNTISYVINNGAKNNEIENYTLNIVNNKITITDLTFGGVLKENESYEVGIGIDNVEMWAIGGIKLKYTIPPKPIDEPLGDQSETVRICDDGAQHVGRYPISKSSNGDHNVFITFDEDSNSYQNFAGDIKERLDRGEQVSLQFDFAFDGVNKEKGNWSYIKKVNNRATSSTFDLVGKPSISNNSLIEFTLYGPIREFVAELKLEFSRGDGTNINITFYRDHGEF